MKPISPETEPRPAGTREPTHEREDPENGATGPPVRSPVAPPSPAPEGEEVPRAAPSGPLSSPGPAAAAPAPISIPIPDHVDALFAELDQQLIDERTRHRRREAIFISVIIHLCVLILLILDPKLPHWLSSSPTSVLVNPQTLVHQNQLTYLVSPFQPPKPKVKVHSNVLSDRDRLYKHSHPLVSSFAGIAPPAPRRRVAARPIRPRPAVRPSPAPRVAAAAPAKTMTEKAPNRQVASKTPGPGAANGLRLENVPRTPARAALPIPIPGMSAESQLRQAIQAAARAETHGGPGLAQMGQLPTPNGLPSVPSPGGNGSVGTGIQITTDTEGVNFHSYLQQILEIVRQNWYAVMPEVAYLGRKGRSVLIFHIGSNGRVTALTLVSASGTLSFDQAALAAINASNPFPPLPRAFRGPFIGLKFYFFYNINPYQGSTSQAGP